MEIQNPDPIPVSSEPTNHKKKYIILGVLGVVIISIVPLLVGLLTPTKKITSVNSQTKPSTGAQISISGPQKTIEKPSLAPTRQPNIDVSPYFQLSPIPTINLDSFISTKPNAPTPTPLPGLFYVANGKQNDLFIRLFQEKDWDQTYQVQLINARTHETRVMGNQYVAAPGDSAYFSHDFSSVIFLGGKTPNVQAISYYSIPKKMITRSITVTNIKKSLPEIQIQDAKTLSRMVISPEGTRAAMSYGYTYNVSAIDASTDIIVVNLSTYKMTHLPVHGLVKDWKDGQTIEYELNSPDPSNNTVTSAPVPNF